MQSPHGCWISASEIPASTTWDSQNPVNEINYQPQLVNPGFGALKRPGVLPWTKMAPIDPW